jgi:hypothetical protein
MNKSFPSISMIHRLIFAALFLTSIMAAPTGQNSVWEGVNPLVRHIRCADPDERAWILTEIAAFNREVSPELPARQP